MAQVTAMIRVRGRRLRSRWRSILVVCGLVAVFAGLALSMLKSNVSRADRQYEAAVAEADTLDPGWRLDDLMARREKIPDNANSALRVHAIFEEIPGGWPGIKDYDRSFCFEGETPEVRLTKGRIDQLEELVDPVANLVGQARQLSDYPRGQLEGMRPRFERFQQVGRLNSYADVSFPYGQEVQRVVFMLWLDAKLGIEAGDLDRAIIDVQAMMCAGRSIGEYPGLSAQMSRAGDILASDPFSGDGAAQGEAKASRLAALQSLLETEDRQPRRTLALRGERAITDDLLEQIHARKLGFSAIPDFSEYPIWTRVFANHVNLRENQATLLRFHTRAVEIDRLPEAEQQSAMKALNNEWVKQAIFWGFFEKDAGSRNDCCSEEAAEYPPGSEWTMP